jgi:DNA modification methylase
VDNLSQLFDTNIRIHNQDPMGNDAVWPHSVEVCVCRVPVRKRDGYSEDFIKCFANRLKPCMVKNGIVFLIAYAPIECKSRPFEIAKFFSDEGFTHIDNIVIHKSWYPGKRSETTLVNSHEFVLHFCNGTVWNLDRNPILRYLKSDPELSCPGNTWTVTTGSLDDSYPVDLAELLVRMTDCLPGSIIFDPFMSSTAGLRTALKLGHSFYGFEIDLRRLKRYNTIVEEFKQKKNKKEKKDDIREN